jgi:hypothetical protein
MATRNRSQNASRTVTTPSAKVAAVETDLRHRSFRRAGRNPRGALALGASAGGESRVVAG